MDDLIFCIGQIIGHAVTTLSDIHSCSSIHFQSPKLLPVKLHSVFVLSVTFSLLRYFDVTIKKRLKISEYI